MISYKPEQYGTTFGVADYDFLTLTTFSARANLAMMNELGVSNGKVIRVRGYVGQDYGNIQMLEGEQKKRPHYIWNFHGNCAKAGIEALVQEDIGGTPLHEHFSCTRIDLQIASMATKEELDIEDIYDVLNDDSVTWNRRGRKPSISMIKGEETKRGMGKTLYIGKKDVKHGSFVRIYEKRGPNGDRYVRYETQYKRKAAQAVLDYVLVNGMEVCKDILMGDIGKLPEQAYDMINDVVKDDMSNSNGTLVSYEKPKSDDHKRYLWFKYDVCKALLNMTDEKSLELTESMLYAMARTLHYKRIGRTAWIDEARGRAEKAKAFWESCIKDGQEPLVDLANPIEEVLAGPQFEQLGFEHYDEEWRMEQKEFDDTLQAGYYWQHLG